MSVVAVDHHHSGSWPVLACGLTRGSASSADLTLPKTGRFAAQNADMRRFSLCKYSHAPASLHPRDASLARGNRPVSSHREEVRRRFAQQACGSALRNDGHLSARSALDVIQVRRSATFGKIRWKPGRRSALPWQGQLFDRRAGLRRRRGVLLCSTHVLNYSQKVHRGGLWRKPPLWFQPRLSGRPEGGRCASTGISVPARP